MTETNQIEEQKPRFYNARDIKDLLQIPTAKVQGMAERNGIPFHLIGGKPIFKSVSLYDLAEAWNRDQEAPDVDDEGQPLLSEAQVSEMIRVPKATLAKMRKNGEAIPHEVRGKRILYRERDVLAYLEGAKIEPAVEPTVPPDAQEQHGHLVGADTLVE